MGATVDLVRSCAKGAPHLLAGNVPGVCGLVAAGVCVTAAGATSCALCEEVAAGGAAPGAFGEALAAHLWGPSEGAAHLVASLLGAAAATLPPYLIDNISAAVYALLKAAPDDAAAVRCLARGTDLPAAGRLSAVSDTAKESFCKRGAETARTGGEVRRLKSIVKAYAGGKRIGDPNGDPPAKEKDAFALR